MKLKGLKQNIIEDLITNKIRLQQDNINMRCKCNNQIPAGRIALGYSNCVNCSSTQQYSYIPIIANKQVLEIQVVSQELSDQVHKAWRRK